MKAGRGQRARDGAPHGIVERYTVDVQRPSPFRADRAEVHQVHRGSRPSRVAEPGGHPAGEKVKGNETVAADSSAPSCRHAQVSSIGSPSTRMSHGEGRFPSPPSRAGTARQVLVACLPHLSRECFPRCPKHEGGQPRHGTGDRSCPSPPSIRLPTNDDAFPGRRYDQADMRRLMMKSHESIDTLERRRKQARTSAGRGPAG